MAQQELNLLNLATVAVTQLRTGSAQVMWGDVFQTCPLTTGPDHIPHHIL